jgi:hypothetical protein
MGWREDIKVLERRKNKDIREEKILRYQREERIKILERRRY